MGAEGQKLLKILSHASVLTVVAEALSSEIMESRNGALNVMEQVASRK